MCQVLCRHFIVNFFKILFLLLLFNIFQLHGYPNCSKTSERPQTEEITKPCNNFVGNFHDTRDDTIGVKSIIIRKSSGWKYSVEGNYSKLTV